MPGVVEIFTGKDVAAAKIGGLICGWVVKDKHGQPHKAPPHPILAVDTVRYVGDPVAVVIAETIAQAKDAAEKIEVDYERAAGGRRSREGHDRRRPRSTPMRRTISATTGSSATRPRSTRPSPRRRTSPSSIS